MKIEVSSTSSKTGVAYEYGYGQPVDALIIFTADLIKTPAK